MVKYTHVATYKEAELILLTYDKVRIVSWEHNMNSTGFIVATEEN